MDEINNLLENYKSLVRERINFEVKVGIEKRANWDSTNALTIFNNIHIKYKPKIIINELR